MSEESKSAEFVFIAKITEEGFDQQLKEIERKLDQTKAKAQETEEGVEKAVGDTALMLQDALGVFNLIRNLAGVTFGTTIDIAIREIQMAAMAVRHVAKIYALDPFLSVQLGCSCPRNVPPGASTPARGCGAAGGLGPFLGRTGSI